MRTYDIVLITQPDLDEASVTALVDKVKTWLGEANAVVESVDIWGKRRLAYTIKKHREGIYILFKAQMPPTFCTTLERNLRLTESVIRFLITLVE